MEKLNRWITPHIPQELNSSTLQALFKSEVPAIVIPKVLCSNLAAYYAKKALDHGFVPYDSAADDIMRLGMSLVDRPNLSDYLNIAECMRAQGLYPKEGISLLHQMIGFISHKVKRSVQVLQHDGKDFWVGVFRNFNAKIGAGIHTDRIYVDSPELQDLPIESQCSMVLHLTCPKEGSSTIVYDKCPRDEDRQDSLFLESGWKYSKQVVSNATKVLVPCSVGAISFINTQKFHEVESNRNVNGERRISYSFFMVKFKNDETVYLYS